MKILTLSWLWHLLIFSLGILTFSWILDLETTIHFCMANVSEKASSLETAALLRPTSKTAQRATGLIIIKLPAKELITTTTRGIPCAKCFSSLRCVTHTSAPVFQSGGCIPY